ncbi:gliding motility lipoprotein GldH [Bacteroides sp. UBA939]|uniref:gliding motility lipoprotein GldH n=1 Tax=Bacteroides sp. UBA939 TaxID=1946092 RepID=UPI0025C72449|nr:gliding motility lipoprotein GldH [Bacteroides sp. UBA939]
MKSRPRHNHFLLKSLILLFVASFFIACDKQVVYHVYQSLPADGWRKQDTLFFKIMASDSVALYSISVEVRNRNIYPYQNLPLLISCDSPEAQNAKKDTLQLTLADSGGVWLGDGWGDLYQSSFSTGYIRIGKAGEYRFKITHLLPDDKLPGINDIGIKLRTLEASHY